MRTSLLVGLVLLAFWCSIDAVEAVPSGLRVKRGGADPPADLAERAAEAKKEEEEEAEEDEEKEKEMEKEKNSKAEDEKEAEGESPKSTGGTENGAAEEKRRRRQTAEEGRNPPAERLRRGVSKEEGGAHETPSSSHELPQTRRFGCCRCDRRTERSHEHSDALSAASNRRVFPDRSLLLVQMFPLFHHE
ncbi:hypothetical protein M3Y99_00557800 [Aphelenchoides fujianensis]|nr:hypothetical protein M3Y99_00557800 [Aphelenchoides fujianensis]